MGHLGYGLLFIPPRLGLTPQLLISKAPPGCSQAPPTLHSPTRAHCVFLLVPAPCPLLAGCEPLPSESSGPISWAHGYFWTFLPLLKWHAHSAPSPREEEMVQHSFQGLSAPGRERLSLGQLCATPAQSWSLKKSRHQAHKLGTNE